MSICRTDPLPPLLQARDIHKSFRQGNDSVAVVAGVGVQLFRGEVVGLIGPSGCGKSTLLNILCGLIDSDQGEIEVSSVIGYIQQHDSLLPWRTVLENCIVPLQLHHTRAPFHRRARQQRAHDAAGRVLLDKVGLLEIANLYPHQISGGMRQKVSFVRAVIEQPQVLLLDEPFRSLDGITKIEMYDWYASIRRQSDLATLLVTHDIHEAAALAGRVIVCTDRPMRVRTVIAAPATPATDSSRDEYARAIHHALRGDMGTRTPDLRLAKPSL